MILFKFWSTVFFLTFKQGSIPENATKLLNAYPKSIISYHDNRLYFQDGTTLLYDDGKVKSLSELINNPDIEDQFFFQYHVQSSKKKSDAGRIRNEDFFKKIYGASEKEVESKLTSVIWCPKLVNQKIKVTTVNDFHKVIEKLSAELDKSPEFAKYISNIAGTFNWRKIAGTNRLSNHSFGMTIDINIKYSNYWQWDCKCQNEDTQLKFNNKIPLKLVEIFEKYGFIWGGSWVHYDTMHFEYRPELL